MKTTLTMALTLFLMTLSNSVGLNFAVAQDSGSNPEVREELNQEINNLYPKVRQNHGSADAETPKAVRIKKESVADSNSNSNNNRKNKRKNKNATTKVAQSNTVTTVTTIQAGASNAAPSAQPPTVVEDSPLKDSRANAIRKQRLQVEQGTEEKIVEHLEDDRIKAEQDRSNRVLKSLNRNSNKKADANSAAKPEVVLIPVQKTESSTPVANQPAVVAPAPVAQPAPVVQSAAPQVQSTAPVVSAAAVESTSDAKAAELDENVKPKEEKSRFFVGALAGVGSYPSLENVKGIYAAGVTVGMIFPQRLILEGTFAYSTYNVQNIASTYYTPIPTITEMDTTSVMAALKYQILKGRFSPVVGGIVSYDSRTFKDTQYYYSSNTSNSQAFDAGLLAGLDVNLNETFTVGLDYRYLFNLTYQRSSSINPGFVYTAGQPGTPIESVSYSIISVNGKVNF